MTASAQQVTGTELVERARALLPRLRERAEQAEQEGRVPAETIAEFRRAGLLRILKPRSYGGHELSTCEQIEIAMELGSACGSSGWVFSSFCEQDWIISLFPRAAQDEVWAGHPDYVASTSHDPAMGRAMHANGGLRVSGTFPFAAGCEHAEYLVLNAALEVPGTAAISVCLVPRSQVTIEDGSFPVGLRGTGSKTVALDNVFVPEQRALRLAEIESGAAPGIALHPSFRQLRAPPSSVAALGCAAVAAGIAEGGIDLFSQLARGHSRRRGGQMEQSEIVQLKLAESAAEVLAAKLLVRNAAQEAIETVRRGERIVPILQARFGRDAAFAGQLSARAVDRLHVAYGARGIFEGNPLARCFRDVHAAIAQSRTTWEAQAALYGRLRLGGEPAPSGQA